jgi:NAD/NADP transhydrogenase alpha subunit
MDFLSGYKTYVVGAAIVLTALGAFLSGDMTLAQAVQAALTGLGLGALRAGVAKP